ncbi:FeoA family protein [Desulfotomaculum nigrificans CO-1-SRB]|uniref:FeoA family protein n=1 Tax=Desulfotomaculum nigrificans (strain DSM 14880 / VKM B-2319 / CO-1-SRB) TaxID=868595 RepID=F6B3N8_DESCC|nr:ferrous iron transport protein A [Desulfotomaculum nigrificans]AEF95197.1 FeoA family protein [Desulfotomaculum nigrificans CO-1-SRB]
MTLDKCKKGQKIKIMNIPNEIIRSQAIRFGISEGAVVTCEEVVPAGPVVVGMYKQQIAIGRNLAKSISVELIN